MASDRRPASPSDDPDIERFEAGASVARSELASRAYSETSYADAFVQQIIHDRVEGRVRLTGTSVPPFAITSQSSVTEGMALRRLDGTSSFAAANGLEPSVGQSVSARIESRKPSQQSISPVAQLRPATDSFVSSGTAFVREVIDSILAGVEGSRLVTVRMSTLSIRKALINTEGHDTTVASSRTELHVHVEIGDRTATKTWVDWGSSTLPSVNSLTVARFFQLESEQRKDSAVQPPERAAILLPPGWGGVWMHEAVGHLVEADTFYSQDSLLFGPLRRQVASDLVTITDDGTLDPSRVSGSFDDEGVEKKVTPLIEDGKLVGLLTDRGTARQHGLALTGNGRRPHFGLPPGPRMTNLLLKPGTYGRDDLKRMAETLLIVDTIHHAWFDAPSRCMHLEIDDARLWRQGEQIGRVGPIMISAAPDELLQNVRGIADDFSIDLDRGYCSKGGAAIPVTVGQPSVLIADLPVRRPAT